MVVYNFNTEIALHIWRPVFYQLSTQLSHIFIPGSNTAEKELETDGPMVKNSFWLRNKN